MGSWVRGILAVTAISAFGLPAPAVASQFGVNGHIPDPAMVERIAHGNIGWVRIDMIWALVEPQPDNFDWSLYDRVIHDLEQQGLRIFATLQGTPAWATDGAEFSGVPRDAGRWRRFCYRAADRYRGRVDAWGLWNEPNLGRFWQGSRTQYLYDILIAGIDAIEMADPDAFVAAPDLAHLQSASWDSWLRSVIGAAGDRLDAVTHHTYPSNGLASDVTRKLDSGSSYPWDPPPVREVLQDTGWWGRPFWLTETGVESDRHSEAGQELFVAQLLEEWFGTTRRRSWIDRVFFYELNDDPTAGSTFGIVGPPPDLEPKLAFEAYRQFIRGAEIDDAALESRPTPRLVPSSGRLSVALEWRNTGTTSWREEDGYAVLAEIDQSGWTVSGGSLPPQRTVHPGSSVVVTLDLQSPPLDPARDPMNAVLTARLRRAFGWPFGDGASVEITQSEGSWPTAEASPRTLVVEEGAPATFSVATGGGGVILRWFRDGAPLSESSRVRGTFRDTLEISRSEPGDAGNYHCEVRNQTGAVTLLAGRLRVVSDAPPETRPSRDPSGRAAATLDRWRTWRTGSRPSVEPRSDRR